LRGRVERVHGVVLLDGVDHREGVGDPCSLLPFTKGSDLMESYYPDRFVGIPSLNIERFVAMENTNDDGRAAYRAYLDARRTLVRVAATHFMLSWLPFGNMPQRDGGSDIESVEEVVSFAREIAACDLDAMRRLFE
jgi:hypothetical protein